MKAYFLYKFLGNLEKSMNEPLQISNDIAMQILDNFAAKLSTIFLKIFNEIPSIFSINLHLQYFRLHLNYSQEDPP